MFSMVPDSPVSLPTWPDVLCRPISGTQNGDGTNRKWKYLLTGRRWRGDFSGDPRPTFFYHARLRYATADMGRRRPTSGAQNGDDTNRKWKQPMSSDLGPCRQWHNRVSRGRKQCSRKRLYVFFQIPKTGPFTFFKTSFPIKKREKRYHLRFQSFRLSRHVIRFRQWKR